MKRVYGDSSQESLHVACLVGDVAAAKRFAGISYVNVNSEISLSPLSLACLKGDYDLAKVLLDNGARIEWDSEVLFHVVFSSCEASTKRRLIGLLVSKGAVINYGRDNFPHTLYQAALSTCCSNTIKTMLRRSAYISKSEDGENSPSSRSSDDVLTSEDLTEIEDLLQIFWKELALLVVMNGGCAGELRTRVVQTQVKGIDVNKGFPWLFVACGFRPGDERFPKPHLVRVLLDAAARPDAALSDGRIALHVLCTADYDSCIDDGDDDDGEDDGEDEDEDDEDEDDDGDDGLGRFNRDTAKCVELLIERGADVDSCDDKGNVPFVLAVANGKQEVADMMLKHQESNYA